MSTVFINYSEQNLKLSHAKKRSCLAFFGFPLENSIRVKSKRRAARAGYYTSSLLYKSIRSRIKIKYFNGDKITVITAKTHPLDSSLLPMLMAPESGDERRIPNSTCTQRNTLNSDRKRNDERCLPLRAAKQLPSTLRHISQLR